MSDGVWHSFRSILAPEFSIIWMQMLECSTWCWGNRVERAGIRSACGSWEVKATDMQAGYCIKLQTLCCRKQKGKWPSENLWDKTHSKPELVGKPWERRTVISSSDWVDDEKSYRIYTEICSIRIVCQSGEHLITCDSADCQLSLSAITISVPKCMFLQAFLSCLFRTFTMYPYSHVLSISPKVFYIYAFVQNPTNSILLKYPSLCPCN